jgi:hypothetical protein
LKYAFSVLTNPTRGLGVNGTTRLLVLLWLVVASGPAAAAEESLSNCIQRQVSFDGISPRAFADVKKEVERAYVHREYPKGCSAVAPSSCKSSVYLVARDVVGTAKVCAGWVYVEYVGSGRTTLGWVAQQDLSGGSEVDNGAETTVQNLPKHYRFELLSGKGTPVCDAYLRRLNETEFRSPPYCGRPEDDHLPGFTNLHRVPLVGNQTSALYPQMLAFSLGKQTEYRGRLDEYDIAGAASGGGGPAIFAWRYEPSLDIDNDGMPDNVLVWAGPPVDQNNVPCGARTDTSGNRLPRGVRWSQWAVLAADDSQSIQADRTLSIFGHPTGGQSIPPRGLTDTVRLGFIPIGSSIGFFKYDGTTYFDTFFDGGGWPDFYGKRADLTSLDDHLGVFEHRNGSTRQICEYLYRGTANSTSVMK